MEQRLRISSIPSCLQYALLGTSLDLSFRASQGWAGIFQLVIEQVPSQNVAGCQVLLGSHTYSVATKCDACVSNPAPSLHTVTRSTKVSTAQLINRIGTKAQKCLHAASTPDRMAGLRASGTSRCAHTAGVRVSKKIRYEQVGGVKLVAARPRRCHRNIPFNAHRLHQIGHRVERSPVPGRFRRRVAETVDSL